MWQLFFIMLAAGSNVVTARTRGATQLTWLVDGFLNSHGAVLLNQKSLRANGASILEVFVSLPALRGGKRNDEIQVERSK